MTTALILLGVGGAALLSVFLAWIACMIRDEIADRKEYESED